MVRWFIQHYTVKYRPGRVHLNADCLSRIRSIQPYFEITDVPLLAERQSEDDLCQQIIKYIDDGELSVLNHCYPPVWVKEINLYTMQNGVLCRQHAPLSSKLRQVEQLQTVIPYSLRRTVCESQPSTVRVHFIPCKCIHFAYNCIEIHANVYFLHTIV